jgi:NAD-dependent dihydropyrimidine dehydrogenase PreA subunit
MRNAQAATNVNYCTLGTYELQEDKGKKKTVVSNPDNCVVLCSQVVTQYAQLAQLNIHLKSKLKS